MKLVINPNDGTITVDTADNISAAQFVRELLSGHATPPPKAIEAKRVAKPAPKKRRRRRKLGPPKADRPLPRSLDETWAYLAASDRSEGISAAEVAEAFGISHGGAGQRLYELVNRDMAWRCSVGRYRVGSLVDGVAILNGAR
jgi:hypothetical protein